MKSFSIVALQILPNCERFIKKVLQEEWYFFTHKYRLDNSELVPNPDYVLPNDFFSPKINICAIVGKNGCGKSAIIEIILRIINNFAANSLANASIDCELHVVNGINAVLYFEIDGELGYIESNDSQIVFKYKLGRVPIRPNSPLKEALSFLKHFFFTIVNNYSFHSYNSCDFIDECAERDKIWINSLFHKNDGYLTPLVLNPFRQDSCLNILRETRLTNSRLASLFYFFKKEGLDFIEGYEYKFLSCQLNKSLIEEKYQYHPHRGKTISKKVRIKKITVSNKKRDYFNITLKAFLGAEYPMGNPCLDSAYMYLVAKTYQISLKYPNYKNNIVVVIEKLSTYCNAKEEKKIHILVEKILKDYSHVTLKIRQVLKYIDYIVNNSSKIQDHLDDDYIEYNPIDQSIQEKLSAIDKITASLPPSFFDIRIGLAKNNEATIYFDKMSSGERQFLFYMSTILYHIRNLDSVTDDEKSVHYDYVNIILEEVELYFHPEYQRIFITKLISYLNKCNFNKIKRFNIIIVTHSPFILSDIPKDNVLFLKEGRMLVASESNEFDTFGANIHDLLRNSFFLDNGLIGEFANKTIATIVSLLQEEQQIELQWTPQEIWYLISNIGEPIIKESLEALYAEKHKRDDQSAQEIENQIIILQEKLNTLKNETHIH